MATCRRSVKPFHNLLHPIHLLSSSHETGFARSISFSSDWTQQLQCPAGHRALGAQAREEEDLRAPTPQASRRQGKVASLSTHAHVLRSPAGSRSAEAAAHGKGLNYLHFLPRLVRLQRSSPQKRGLCEAGRSCQFLHVPPQFSNQQDAKGLKAIASVGTASSPDTIGLVLKFQESSSVCLLMRFLMSLLSIPRPDTLRIRARASRLERNFDCESAPMFRQNSRPEFQKSPQKFSIASKVTRALCDVWDWHRACESARRDRIPWFLLRRFACRCYQVAISPIALRTP
eukprot:1334985-Rhodomonas_salina.10